MSKHRILIVNSPYYGHISEELEAGAREALEASEDEIEIDTTSEETIESKTPEIKKGKDFRKKINIPAIKNPVPEPPVD